MKRLDRPLIIFLLLAVSVFVMVVHFLRIGVNEQTAFFAPDAREYRATAFEFFDLSSKGYSYTRPFLYPLFLRITMVGGLHFWWLCQVAMWIASAGFIFLAAKRISGRRWIAFLAGLLFVANLSLIALTFHALTEVITVFLLSWLCYYAAVNRHRLQTAACARTLLLFFVLLTVIKPLFLIPLLLFLFVIIPVGYFRSRKNHPVQVRWTRTIFSFALVLSPLLLQVGVMKYKYGSFMVSGISNITLRNYLLAEIIDASLHTGRDSSVTIAGNKTAGELAELVEGNKMLTAKVWYENVRGNIIGEPVFLQNPVGMEQPNYSAFMERFNLYTWSLHRIMLLLFFPCVFLLKKRKETELMFFLLSLGAINYYIIFSSGISFWQGDRLTLPALPVWIVQYFLCILVLVRAASSFTGKFKAP